MFETADLVGQGLLTHSQGCRCATEVQVVAEHDERLDQPRVRLPVVPLHLITVVQARSCNDKLDRLIYSLSGWTR